MGVVHPIAGSIGDGDNIAHTGHQLGQGDRIHRQALGSRPAKGHGSLLQQLIIHGVGAVVGAVRPGDGQRAVFIDDGLRDFQAAGDILFLHQAQQTGRAQVGVVAGFLATQGTFIRHCRDGESHHQHQRQRQQAGEKLRTHRKEAPFVKGSTVTTILACLRRPCQGMDKKRPPPRHFRPGGS